MYLSGSPSRVPGGLLAKEAMAEARGQYEWYGLVPRPKDPAASEPSLGGAGLRPGGSPGVQGRESALERT